MTSPKKNPTTTADAAEAQKAETAATNAAPADKPRRAYVVAVNGDMLHLFTNVWFTKDPKRVEIDGFVQTQLDAGKLAIFED